MAGELVCRGGRRGGANGYSVKVVAQLTAIAVLVLLTVVPAAYGYGLTEFMRDYKNPSVSRIQVKGDVILTSDLPPLERNLTITGSGSKRPVIDGQNKYSGIETSDVLVVRNVEFRNFVTRRENGGAAILSFGDNNKFENCVFLNNRALLNSSDSDNSDYGNGGAMNFYGNTWRIVNCQFLANRADWYGGAVYTRGESSGRVTGSVFKDNYSKARGGAITFRGSYANIDKCTFERNKEDGEGGGALSCSKSLCRISNNVFRSNIAKGEGGAIRFFADDEGYGVLCKGNTFSGNRATNSSTSNLYVWVTEEGGPSWSFCAKAPPKTVVDAPSGGTKNGDCEGCPK